MSDKKIQIVERKITLLSEPRLTSPLRHLKVEGGVEHILAEHVDSGARHTDVDAIINASDAAILCQFAGRGCYRSFDVPSEKTNTPQKYLLNLARQKHLSVFEHPDFAFHLENISRAASHEIVRHRHFSFSQESQRYVTDKRGWEVVLPPAMKGKFDTALGEFLVSTEDAFESRDELLLMLHNQGYNKKQTAEAARSVTPNAAATSMVMKGNARSWMEFISKRHSPAADAELQEIAGEIWDLLAVSFPEAFANEEVVATWYEHSEQKGHKF